MTTTLKLYKADPLFPHKKDGFPGDNDKQACLADYKYSATRMSSAPNITATLKWPTCLDNEWSTKVFVEYKGERFFIKNTPSSSYDNSSCLYSHSLELVSERAVLDSVYFLNVPVKITNEDGEEVEDALSDSSEFSFSGDIHEFVDRLNKSFPVPAAPSISRYSAVVDPGVTSDAKLFDVSNMYITDALKAAYELYEVPYYFDGMTIHFGNQQEIISKPKLEYGVNKQLLSISKSNANKQVVTRATGYGSDRNIPYYYPNPTPKGTIYLESTSKTATFEVKNINTFCNKLELDKVLEYKGVDYAVEMTSFSLSYDDESYIGYNDSSLFDAEYGKDVWISVNFNVEHDFVDTYVKCIFSTVDRGDRGLTELYVDSKLTGKDGSYPTPRLVDGMLNCGKLEKAGYTLKLHLRYSYVGSDKYQGRFKFRTINKAYWAYEGTDKSFDITKASIFIIDGKPTHGDKLCQRLEYRIDVRNNLMPSEYRRTLGGSRWYIATNSEKRGEYYGDVVFDNIYDSSHPSEYIHQDEEIFPTIKGVTNAAGERIDSFLEIAFDKFDNNEIYGEDHEKAGEYIHPYFFAKLKKTDGPNGFNLFDHAIEKEEMKISFTTGHVASCEFVIGVDEDSQKNTVQVYTEDTWVDGHLHRKGELMTDENGDILCNRWGQKQYKAQDEQQDTQNNEVWIALRKDDSTMGVLMPDTKNNLIPLGDLNAAGDLRDGGGDLFVILGIHLPESYITAAEDRLEKEIIKYLAENNKEKFSFTLKLSSIYLAENEVFAKSLNENSRVTLIYNGVPYTMYVTSYSLTVKESSALPEVTISINDELKVVKPKLKDISSFIDLADNRIKDVKRESTTIKAQALSANSSAKDNAEKIRQLQEMLANVDLSSLAGQVLENTANINILDRRVTVAILDEDYSQPEQASFMSRLRPNEELVQDENNDTTIALVDDSGDAIIYVANDDIGDTYEDEGDYTALMIEDAIIVEEIIDCEIIYNNEDDTPNVISGDGEDETSILADEGDETLIGVPDDELVYTIINEDDGQTTITNC